MRGKKKIKINMEVIYRKSRNVMKKNRFINNETQHNLPRTIPNINANSHNTIFIEVINRLITVA